MLTRDEMIDALTNNVCSVTFKKANGEVRNMLCTRNPKFVVVNEEEFEDSSNSRVVVFDTVESQIRSFRPNTVTNFQVDSQI